jgi:hypothetical protein
MDEFGSDSAWRTRYELVHTAGNMQLLRRR